MIAPRTLRVQRVDSPGSSVEADRTELAGGTRTGSHVVSYNPSSPLSHLSPLSSVFQVFSGVGGA